MAAATKRRIDVKENDTAAPSVSADFAAKIEKALSGATGDEGLGVPKELSALTEKLPPELVDVLKEAAKAFLPLLTSTIAAQIAQDAREHMPVDQMIGHRLDAIAGEIRLNYAGKASFENFKVTSIAQVTKELTWLEQTLSDEIKAVIAEVSDSSGLENEVVQKMVLSSAAMRSLMGTAADYSRNITAEYIRSVESRLQ